MLSEYKLACDSALAQSDTLLNNCQKDKIDLRNIITEKDKQIGDKQKIIDLGDERLKNAKKAGWRRTAIGAAIVAVTAVIVKGIILIGK